MTGLGVALVMPVYAGTSPDHLDEALSSVMEQTRPVDEVIVVADGALTEAHESVLTRAGDRVRVLRLGRRAGGARAREAGIASTTADVIVMADADDVSMPHRVETQLSLLTESGADVVGAAMEEFDTVSGKVIGVRRFPADPERIAGLMRSRNPINHPTVVVRRDSLMAVGGYHDLPFLEDYDLWARMLSKGYVLRNTPDVLVRYRGGRTAQQRRRIRGYVRHEITLQRNLRTYGLASRRRTLLNLATRVGYRLLPGPLAIRAYTRVFVRRRDENPPAVSRLKSHG